MYMNAYDDNKHTTYGVFLITNKINVIMFINIIIKITSTMCLPLVGERWRTNRNNLFPSGDSSRGMYSRSALPSGNGSKRSNLRHRARPLLSEDASQGCFSTSAPSACSCVGMAPGEFRLLRTCFATCARTVEHPAIFAARTIIFQYL